ncbi:MAG TPA: signal recognition particle protein [Bacillota bacterium]|nr:signal recognition particle protein [Clostridiaceae bacterium]HNR04273.1 signal recognition particle protein [Bacillota bacterium]HNT03092.1 signal recognition particle protein [Bacillota bacterium]HPA54326.1 signal recognition particle protein [Bacillota bacterium]HPX68529.1 signal recognition particle protein [Bacillota bacterium]
MAFEGLAEKLQNTLKKLRGAGKLSEKDVKDAMREVKMALLEADVSFKVVKEFITKVTERAVGQEVLDSLTPGQQVIKIVNEQMTELMGNTNSKIIFSPKPPTILMMVGLQGAGKTTTCGKLGLLLKKQGKNPLLVAGDVYRPAAIKQLQVVGSQVGIEVFAMGDKVSPVDISKAAAAHALKNGNDVVIIDTAGRLHINEELMDELADIKENVKPTEILLVVDSMTGQDAVNVAESFNEKLGIDGVILTKLDGDTRGGAALSVKAITGKPIKFAGMGEKLNELEPFHPDRMASRILGMGDVLSLIEKAQSAFDEKKAVELERKIRTQQFTFDDFLDQLQQMKKMGPLSSVLEMLPGMNPSKLKGMEVDDKELVKVEAIIRSMTKKERHNPDIINGSRRKRIAAGSGTSIQDVNRVMKNFEQSKKMMKQFAGMEKDMKKGKMKMPFFR